MTWPSRPEKTCQKTAEVLKIWRGPGSLFFFLGGGGAMNSKRRFFDRKCFVSNSDKIWGVEGQPKFHFQGQKKLVYEGHT